MRLDTKFLWFVLNDAILAGNEKHFIFIKQGCENASYLKPFSSALSRETEAGFLKLKRASQSRQVLYWKASLKYLIDFHFEGAYLKAVLYSENRCSLVRYFLEMK